MKDIKEMIDIMQAFANGKTIEVTERDSHLWVEDEKPLWDWNTFDYRIKPGPKTRFMTHRELARWCAEGKGQFKMKSGKICHYEHVYDYELDDGEVSNDILIRSWNETEWHKPLVEVEE